MSAGSPIGRLRSLVVACLLAALALPAAATADEVLIVANHDSDALAGMRVDTAGALTPVAGSPFATAGGPVDVAVSPEGSRIYATNVDEDKVSAYDVRPDGSLAAVAGSPFAAANPTSLTLSPDGRRLFVGGDPDVNAFDVAPNGALAPVAGSPFSGDGGAVDIAITPDGRYLYTANFSAHSFSGFEVGPGGALTALPGSPFALPGWGVSGVAVDPSGDQLYVLAEIGYGQTDVNVYDLGNDGTPTAHPGPPPAVGGLAGAILVAPDDEHLYVPSYDSVLNANEVTTFAIAANGDLSGAVTTPTGANPAELALTPDGRHLYVSNYGSADISAYDVAADGSLTALAGSPFSSGGDAPSGLAVATTPPNPPPELAPETEIKGKPKYRQAEDTRFRFRSSIDGSTFKCRLDDARYRDCRSPKNYKHLKRGRHRFNVYAISPAGIADPSPATVRFRVKAERKGKR